MRIRNANWTFDITAYEHDTVKSLQQTIMQELGILDNQKIEFTCRSKVLSAGLTLKQERLESGEIVDVMVRRPDGRFDYYIDSCDQQGGRVLHTNS